jgi:hypothetical protein
MKSRNIGRDYQLVYIDVDSFYGKKHGIFHGKKLG